MSFFIRLLSYTGIAILIGLAVLILGWVTTWLVHFVLIMFDKLVEYWSDEIWTDLKGFIRRFLPPPRKKRE